jgi:hypothetical protein
MSSHIAIKANSERTGRRQPDAAAHRPARSLAARTMQALLKAAQNEITTDA